MAFRSVFGAALLAFVALAAAASAADPYFAPYGSLRGRIHVGPRHAHIRWGGGLTQYGSAVLIHGFDVAGSVGKVALGGSGGTGEDSGSVGSESTMESNKADCQEQLRRTKELLEETKKNCSLRGGQGGPEVSAEPGAEPVAPPPMDPYSRVESVKRQVAESLPLIAELQKTASERKQAAEAFEKVLARDRKAFEAFVNAYKSP